MKYGLLSVPKSQNIGDAVQSVIIRDIYRERGAEFYGYVPRGETGGYSGETVVLPMNSWNMYRGPRDAGLFRQSTDIDYRYLGFHLEGELVTFGRMVRLSSKHPIGCRDIPTRDFLRKLGYDAYFSGCVSMTLPRRRNGDYRLVYVIDDDARKALPFCDPGYIRVLTSICLPGSGPWEASEDSAKNRLALLRDTAKLVITSRLHVYMPCVAMGIPVTFTRHTAPRTSPVDIFTPDTVEYLKPLVVGNFNNMLFGEGGRVADELDRMADALDKRR